MSSDEDIEEKRRKYIEEQKALERWAKSGYTSGYSTIEDVKLDDEVEEDVNE